MKRLYYFNNKIKTFLETDTLPNNIDANELYLLNKLYVVYKVNVPNGMIYIGNTQDIGQRMSTHTKCGRNIEKKMYDDIRKYGECTFEILAICKTKKEAKTIENKTIGFYERDFLEKRFGKILPLIDENERKTFLFDKIYNKNKNINY